MAFLFMPTQVAPVIDNVFSALGFERVRISDQVHGVPRIALKKLSDEVIELKRKMELEESELKSFIEKGASALFKALFKSALPGEDKRDKVACCLYRGYLRACRVAASQRLCGF